LCLRKTHGINTLFKREELKLKHEKILALQVVPLRVLQALGEVPNGFELDKNELSYLTETKFKKLYSNNEIEKACITLIGFGLFQKSEDDSKHFLTGEGRRVINILRRLAEDKPDPWRRFTRPSRSQNVTNRQVAQSA
jgi:hypothetical protein